MRGIVEIGRKRRMIGRMAVRVMVMLCGGGRVCLTFIILCIRIVI